MYLALFISILIAIVALLTLAIRSENIFGRTLAVNALGTVIALLLVTLGALQKEVDYFDIALLYVLLNFSATLALLRLFKSRQISGALLRKVSQVPLNSERESEANAGARDAAEQGAREGR